MDSQDHAVAREDAVAEGAMLTVAAGETKILLARVGGHLYAVSATCPHAGSNLAEGVLCGERVTCQWHKASFSVTSGALLDPPAVDSLPTFPVRIENGRIVVSVPSEAPTPAPRVPQEKTADGRSFIIIGGGAAGAIAAQTLREEGFGGRIVLLDRENRVPYDRTLLSKYYLSGETGAEKTPLQKQSWYRGNGIERITADVARLDPSGRRIITADGRSWRYDAALLATGSVAREIDTPGAHRAGVFTLRNRADAETILAAAERGGRVVVLGAGFIGLEVAASLRERGLDVTVAAPEREPMIKQVGPEIGAILRGVHEKQGVRFRLATELASLDGDAAVRSVTLTSGETLAADFVVVGAGAKPALDFETGLALDASGGIAVDDRLRVAHGLYAAGDIAAFPLFSDGERVRVEHWRVAQQQGRLAARNMLGRDLPYDAVPMFWTIQYMKRLDYVGHATEYDEVVIDGDREKPEFVAYYVKDGLVAAVAGWDRDKQMATVIDLFSERQQWTLGAMREALESVG